MNKIWSKILTVLLILALMIPTLAFGDDTEDSGDTSEKSISIIFSHDMHSHIEKFAKMKTVINEKKDENPATFVFDAGDFSMGTPYQTIYKTQASELRMMGAVGYDATTLGNHEFDFRSSGLSTMLNSAISSGDELPQLVISNIDWKSTLADKTLAENGERLQKTLSEYGAKEYTVIEKEGVKIAVFDIFGNESASYAPESGTLFSDPVETAKKIVAQIKEKEDADLIVCLSHSGTNENDPDSSEDEILAKSVNGIDLIISGHSHTKLDEPLIENGTAIVSAGQYCDNLGTISFTYDDGKFKLDEHQLVALNDQIEDDSDTEELIENYKELVNDEYFSQYDYDWDKTLASLSFDFTPIDTFGIKQGEDTLGNLISDSYIYGVKEAEKDKYEKVDVAIVPAGVVRGSFSTGKITVADAFNASSLGVGKDGKSGYPLVSVYLTGKELKTVAEVDASVSEMMQPARLYMSGLKYTYNPNRLFLNRSFDVSLDLGNGATDELDNDKLYRVVGDLYSCQMLGEVNSQSYGILSVTPKNKNGEEITNFEDYIIYGDDGAELKEWYALASYIDSFEEDQVPSYYSQTQNRKNVEDSKSLTDLLKHPNKIFWMLLGAIIVVIAIIILIIWLIIRLVRRIRFGKQPRKLKGVKQDAIFSSQKNKYKARWKK